MSLRRVVPGVAISLAALLVFGGLGLLEVMRDIRADLENASSLSAVESFELHASSAERLRELRWGVGLLGAALIGAVFFAARMLRQRILIPLESLREAAARIGKGDFGARVDLPADDELGAVAARLNELANNLQSLQARLHDDLAERQAAESRLSETEERLRQSQKMEAVGRLAGGVAHDFNNLLTVINCCSELALARVDGDEILRQDLMEVRNAGARAADLTRQLLAFGRKQVMRPEALDLDEVVAENARMLRRLVGESMRIEHSPSPATLWVKADRGQLGQVLLNLVVNARDAMPHGGRVTLTTDRVSVGVQVELGGDDVASGEYATIVVRDEGSGMDEDTRARAFEPFFTTKDAGQGTGLGLSTVYGIIRQSEGYITVESEPDRGTAFTVYLPLVTAEPADNENDALLSPAPQGHSIAANTVEAGAPQKRREKSVN